MTYGLSRAETTDLDLSIKSAPSVTRKTGHLLICYYINTFLRHTMLMSAVNWIGGGGSY